MQVRTGFVPVLAAVVAIACGGVRPASQGRVVAQTPPPEPDADTESVAVLVERDARRARDVLADAVAHRKSPDAYWAAVYATWLDITRDEAAADAALAACIADGDAGPLVSALCWRWVGARPHIPVSADAVSQVRDPAIAALARAALVARDPQDPRLAAALHAERPDRVVDACPQPAVPPLLQAVDDGAVAAAVAFVTARRWLRGVRRSGAVIPCSTPFSDALMRYFPVLGPFSAAADWPDVPTRVPQSAASPLAAAPRSDLRGLAMGAPAAVAIDALRALAVVGNGPVVVADLAAAAQAMEQEDRAVEAARTFLLLVKKGTES